MNNMKAVREAIQAGHRTRAAIVAATGMTDAAAKSALSNLIHRKKVVFEPGEKNPRGRPHNIYRMWTPEDEPEPVLDTVQSALRARSELQRVWA